MVDGRDGPRWRLRWTAAAGVRMLWQVQGRGRRCAPGRGERDEKHAAISNRHLGRKQTECHPTTATKILLSSLGTYYYCCISDEHRGKSINGDWICEKQWYHDIIARNKCFQHYPKNDRNIMYIYNLNSLRKRNNIVNYQNHLCYRSKR